MTVSISRNTANNTSNTPSEYVPCVRYGFPPDSEQPCQEPELRSIYDAIPEGASTASPVYLLTQEQYNHQIHIENPYKVEVFSCIAKELQDVCEQADRVYYPIYIESDAFPEVRFEQTIQHISEFVEIELDCTRPDCTFYYSGNRSIHAHIPKVVATENDRKRLKERAKQFCERTGAEFDLGIYSRKRQFRLPGVIHRKTDLPKIEIEPDWNHDRIVREATNTDPLCPDTYADVLTAVFPVPKPATSGTECDHILPVLGSEEVAVSFSCDAQEIEPPLIERPDLPRNRNHREVKRWTQYNAKEFSPYAHAEGNGRSVAVVQVKGGAFARKTTRNGATMIPVYFYGARGCAGEFTKIDEHAPLQLSEQDYAKWDYQPSDRVALIGGQSRNSRLFRVEPGHAPVAGHTLTGEDGSRQAALDYLASEGYEVESAGSTATSTARNRVSPTEATRIWPARENPQTEAEALQRKAEQEGIATLSHSERIQVACRHLRYGWKPAWDWFQEQFGPEFKPEVTWEQFRSVIEAFPEDYDHIEVPEKPI